MDARNPIALRNLPTEQLADLCRRYSVRELCVFGSVARGEARPGSDIDLLVEFDGNAQIGFFAFSELEEKLSELLKRPVDLVSKRGLKEIIRDQVLVDAEVVFAA